MAGVEIVRRRRATANCGLGRLGEEGRRSDSKASDGIVTPCLVAAAEGGEIEVEATVEPLGAMGPHGFDRQPGTPEPTGTHKH